MTEFQLTNEFGAGSLQGYLACSYARIVEIFGEPNTATDEYKTDAEWTIKFPDCTIASIYNYKNGKNYEGDDGLAVEDITEWNVGGKTEKAIMWVKRVLREHKDA